MRKIFLLIKTINGSTKIYNQNQKGKKAESSNERSSQKGSTEVAKCSLHICNLRQPLSKPSSCGSKERRIHCDQE